MVAIPKVCAKVFSMLLFFACSFHAGAQSQNRQIVIPEHSQFIADTPAPMENVAGLLEQMYIKPVTYEDPILNWSGDIDQVPNSLGEKLKIPKRRSISMPSEVHPRQTATLDAALLNRVLDAYNKQTDGPRFTIGSSRWGLHIIPDQVRDRNGHFVKAVNFLDTFISIPMQKRTPSGHFEAICNAVNASASIGIKLQCFTPYVDAYFAESQLSKMPTEEEIERISFSWGIERRMAARDALIDLLEQSATTLTWRLLCDTQPVCALNIIPMEVNYMGSDGKPVRTALSHD